MSSFLIRTVAWSAVAIVLGVGVSLAWLNRDSLLGESDPHLDEHNGDYSAADSRVTIRAVKPRPNRGELIQEVNQPVYVQGLYTAALQARVAGTVKAVNKFIGDRVKMGEPLIVIHAPDLEQAAAQKQALVKLAEQQVKAMQAVLVAYQAAAKAAQATVQEKEATIDRGSGRGRPEDVASGPGDGQGERRGGGSPGATGQGGCRGDLGQGSGSAGRGQPGRDDAGLCNPLCSI